MTDDDRKTYEARLDAFELYHKYEYPARSRQNGDWKVAALRGPALPALGHAVAGAAGSAVSNVATYPLKLIVTRMQLKKAAQSNSKSGVEQAGYHAIVDAARRIYAKDGIRGFFIGVGDDTWKTIADSFLFFLAYTILRQQRLNSRMKASGRKRAVLPILDELAIGMLAGAFSKLWTTPLANIVTRKQTAASTNHSEPISTRKLAEQIMAEKGIPGFWSGYSESLVLTLNPSITFFLNEFLKYLLLPRHKRRNPPPTVTFLLAAISKSVASTITYPVSLAKTRVQADPSRGKDDRQESRRKAFAFNLFTSLQAIAAEEGIGSLYDGLIGEVLKGFLSHGITMLTKDAVHSGIVHTYYALLILTKKYPSPEELIIRARLQAEEYAEVMREGAKDVAETVKEGVSSVTSTNAAVDMSSHAPPAYSPFEDTHEMAEIVGDYVEDDAVEWRNYGSASRWSIQVVAMEWHPASFFRTDIIPPNPYAILILNQPINENAFDAARRHACYILLADGGANRYYDLMKSRSVENIDLPSCIIGDLDSIHPHVRAHYASHKIPVLYNPDQYSTDFMKCLRFLRAHSHSIMSQENPAVTSDNHDLYMTSSGPSSSSSLTTGTEPKQAQKLDIVVLGGLGGRVDQGFSQVHHLYAAYEEKKEAEEKEKTKGQAAGDLYLLSEESISFILPPGKNVIHTPLTHRRDQQQQGGNGETESTDSKWVFSENVGIIPLSGPTLISLHGFEWDVTDWRTEIGGNLSTSNHIRADRIGVDVDEARGRAVLFTVELGERFKKGQSAIQG
ncbi:hypothetical protein UA08_09345 [Talaromyces atroroseus]|uniref:Thiamin pyrophosphokinase thiamin-binding domain-containing protein n=1 Tax=Talaromyces atroroseus TaxID=1441469 RepID=A0A1Q5Q6L9_TALAT|nr:hypothetical protein UA08_09345 [Talaromyces atroroseus]OKL55390.1 hypothetical protein UA08_09345 [Talaromyces atroroseus]